MPDPFEAVVGGPAAWLSLDARGRVRATGCDRVRFLNGMLSNQIEGPGVGSVVEALQLDRKGHVVAPLRVWIRENEILLDTAPGSCAGLVEILEKHIIADDVELETLGTGESGAALEGPGARAALSAAGLPTPDAGRFQWYGSLAVAGRGALTAAGFSFVGERAELERVAADLAQPVLDEQAAEVLRVERGRPRWGVELTDRTFPQEARLETTAVSFTKGCYIGQEIVARIDSRGSVNRLLVQLACDGPVAVGAAITYDGRNVGSVTSAVHSPTLGALALGYAKREATEPGSEVTVGGTRARVREPLPA